MILLNSSTFPRQLTLFTSLLSMLVWRAVASEPLPPFLLDTKALDASAVVDNARRALKLPIATVVDKERPSPTGDPHDYVSYGRYWWPNPATTNGLPFVQRDGYPN